MPSVSSATIITHYNHGDWRTNPDERHRLLYMIQCKMGYVSTTETMFKALEQMYDNVCSFAEREAV